MTFEIVGNILKGNLKITPKYKKLLTFHKETLIDVWEGKGNIEKQRLLILEHLHIIAKVLESSTKFFNHLPV